MRKKFEEKIKHLNQKYRKDEDEILDEVPEIIDKLDLNLDKLRVFDRGRFEEIKLPDYEIKTIGEVQLNRVERRVLEMHPKCSIIQKLPEDALDHEQELAYAKTRMELRKEMEQMEEEN